MIIQATTMEYSSSNVDSNQTEAHDKVGEVVQKHWHTQFQKPIAEHTHQAYQQAIAAITLPPLGNLSTSEKLYNS